MANSVIEAIRQDEAKLVELTRKEVRDLLDVDITETLASVLDEAQGEADEPGKTVYVILEISGETL
jgi:hypothetical protein